MTLRRNRRAARRLAFTLTEILVVVAIIVVLAGVAVPVTLGVMDNAKRDTAHAQCMHLAEAVHQYMSDQTADPSGAVPASWEEIEESRIQLDPQTLRDPWGGQYQLVPGGQHNPRAGFEVQCNPPSGDPVGNW